MVFRWCFRDSSVCMCVFRGGLGLGLFLEFSIRSLFFPAFKGVWFSLFLVFFSTHGFLDFPRFFFFQIYRLICWVFIVFFGDCLFSRVLPFLV